MWLQVGLLNHIIVGICHVLDYGIVYFALNYITLNGVNTVNIKYTHTHTHTHKDCQLRSCVFNLTNTTVVWINKGLPLL